jgi:hypothetical protein
MKVVVMVRGGVRELERRKALRLISKERFCSGEYETLEEAADKEGARSSGEHGPSCRASARITSLQAQVCVRNKHVKFHGHRQFG